MNLFTPAQREQLIANGKTNRDRRNAGQPETDLRPVVKLFTPDANCTWLLSELDPEEPDIAFGLCDLGQGFPELGSVSVAELSEIRGWSNLSVERDRHFEATKTIAAYAAEARTLRRIGV